MHYWDTSTLAKLYVEEPDSGSFLARLATGIPAVTSELTRWELFRVAARKEAEGIIGAGQAETIFARFQADVSSGRITLLPFNQAVEIRYQEVVLRLHRLRPAVAARTLDCIHLATADLAGVEEVIVTDAGFRKAALAIGLKVFP
jgi:predicted nucleic acid-binding protein